LSELLRVNPDDYYKEAAKHAVQHAKAVPALPAGVTSHTAETLANLLAD
jgi:hypothetical protein